MAIRTLLWCEMLGTAKNDMNDLELSEIKFYRSIKRLQKEKSIIILK